MRGAAARNMHVKINPTVMFNQKIEERWRSSITFLCISAAPNPISLNRLAKPVKTTIIPIRPKSLGVSRRARITEIINCNISFATFAPAVHSMPNTA